MGIERLANAVLTSLGKTRKTTTYYPLVGVGGDFFGDYVERIFENRDLSIREDSNTFDDGSGYHRLEIYSKNKGNSIFSNFLYFIGFGEEKLVFALNDRKIKTFKKGPWQKQLEVLVARAGSAAPSRA